jgi:hypothetical protein
MVSSPCPKTDLTLEDMLFFVSMLLLVEPGKARFWTTRDHRRRCEYRLCDAGTPAIGPWRTESTAGDRHPATRPIARIYAKQRWPFNHHKGLRDE